jgi:hypothetical protein
MLLPDRVFVNISATSVRMDFKSATDRLTERITADEIAQAFGVARNSIARARLDPSSSAYRSPPDRWRVVLARLARERSSELNELANDLERS